MKKVYLCGGIKDLSIAEACNWRDKATKDLSDNLGCNFLTLNPMRRNFRDCEFQSQNEIVQLDKNDIIAADIILVNATKPSWGTAMEVLFAFERNKIIVAFTGTDFKETSPWLAFHATRVCKTYDEAISYIQHQLEDEE